MAKIKAVPYSILDLSPIVQGGSATDSIRRTLDLAQQAERLGYTRYWVAEHHGMPGIASAATSIVIGYIAGGTSSIRVGAGGIMLPNHAPLIIAEQFGTLESMYPGRIDLGLGRAPGTDQQTMRALRRDVMRTGDSFPEDLAELQFYFMPGVPGQTVKAVPGAGLNIPIWLLGSSDFSARLAAEQGLRFAFASHFAPDYLFHSLKLYRDNFKPSENLKSPYAMVGVNLFAASTEEEGYRLSTSMQLQFLSLVRSTPGQLQPPVDSMETVASPAEQAHVDRMMRVSAVGSFATVQQQIQSLLEATHADELMFTGHIYDHAARIRSFEIGAEVMRSLAT
jgi:luciferase family oxidoreductase group 1